MNFQRTFYCAIMAHNLLNYKGKGDKMQTEYSVYDKETGHDKPITESFGKYWYGEDWKEVLSQCKPDAFDVVSIVHTAGGPLEIIRHDES